jgi:hypothetical protein
LESGFRPPKASIVYREVARKPEMKPDAKKDEKNIPACFGLLEVVFPKDESGLRTAPPACLMCMHKVACLRSAMESEGGLKVREDQVDRAYDSGMIGFLERWSQKKTLRRRRAKGKTPVNRKLR